MSLKQEIDQKFGLNSKIRMGGMGALDVIADGQTIFSKKTANRMPTTAEILQALTLHHAG